MKEGTTSRIYLLTDNYVNNLHTNVSYFIFKSLQSHNEHHYIHNLFHLFLFSGRRYKDITVFKAILTQCKLNEYIIYNSLYTTNMII